MENDEILKQLEWLDAERRKDRQSISELLDTVSGLQQTIIDQKRDIKNLQNDQKKSTVDLVRVGEFEEAISKQRVDIQKQVSDVEKKTLSVEKKLETQRRDDLDVVNKRLLEIQNEIKVINDLKKTIQSTTEDDFRINEKIDDLVRQFPDLKLKDEEMMRLHKALEDNYRLESKRVSDIQVEVTSLRKKIDEERTTTDSQKEFLKKLDTSINDLVTRERLREQQQIQFIESQSRQNVDFEKLWKEWQSKIDQIETLSNNFQTQLVNLDNTHRAVKKSQSDFDDINQRLDRRINEITEMNRLAEERFRQEWIAFKADDQKRWTNYSLSQEETSREGVRELERITEQITQLQDITQGLSDAVNIINEETEKRIKGLLSVINDFLTSFEKTIGRKV